MAKKPKNPATIRTPDSQQINALIAEFGAGHYQQVAQLASSMTLKFPQHGFGWIALGVALKQMGQLADALPALQKGAALSPMDADAHNNLGVTLMELGHYTKAETSYLQALQIRPEFAEAYNNLGNNYRALNQSEAARISYLQAIHLKTDYAVAHNNLGVTLKDLNLLNEAHASVIRALELMPDYAEAHSNLSAILQDMGRFADSELSCRRALQINPQLVRAHNNLAGTLRVLHNPEAAKISYENALRIDPLHLDSLHGLGHLYLEQGNIEQANTLYRQILQIQPLNMAVRYSLTTTDQNDEDNFAVLKSLAAQPDALSSKDKIYLHFALGKAYHDRADYTHAFKHYQSGNTLKRATLDYRPEAESLRYTGIMQSFDAIAMTRMRTTGDPSRLPVFILGMPRSGTTLVEQIIASHPDVYGAGELADLLNLVQNFHASAQPGIQHEPDKLTQLGSEYLNVLKKRAPNALRVTDKMPGNFSAIGLIHLILPNAKIIHVRRNPLDTCLSCFTQLFTHGHEYSYELTELGLYYAGYRQLMEHWRSVLPKGSFLEVDYEEIIADQITQARRLIDYCELEWNDSCLDFHATNRPIQTASVMQVRQPIYNSSVERWRHYGPCLTPLIAALKTKTAKPACS